MTLKQEKQQKDKSNGAQSLITIGAQAVGGAIGAGAGFLLGGPLGAAAGGAGSALFTQALDNVGQDIQRRLISPGELRRVGVAMWYASLAIRSRLNNGQKIRTDDFFQQQPDDRAAANEVLEHVLLAAQRDPQEKKLKYYGNLLAAFPFVPTISRADANLLVRRAEELSYRQLCLLSLLTRRDVFSLRRRDYRGAPISSALEPLLQEIIDLNNIGMVILSQNDTYNAGETAQLFAGTSTVRPARMFVVGSGTMLYDLMELHGIPFDELNEIAADLQ